MPETMRAVDIKDGKGPIENLFITEIPKPTPKPTDAIVKIKAFGLNRMDLIQRVGMYPVPPQAPSTLGVEFSGTIESFGSDAEKDFKVGDEVFGLAYGGAYAEYIAVSTHMLLHKPKEMSWEEAAGIPETWITALQALYLIGEFAPGKSVLWHAGASSVSISGIQLAKFDGASKVFATTRSDEKNKFCVEKLGATGAFNSKTEDWSKRVLEATDGKGVDIIVDFIGADVFQGNIACCARDGRIVSLGMMSGSKTPSEGVDFGMLLYKRIRWEGSTLRSRDEAYQGKLRDLLFEHAMPGFKEGKLKVHVEKVFDWEQIQDAQRLMESNKTQGKIICRVE